MPTRRGHRVIWDEARILETESNSRYRIYQELTCFNKPYQPTQFGYLSHLDPSISDEVTKSKRSL
jgi:hypothetical protein